MSRSGGLGCEAGRGREEERRVLLDPFSQQCPPLWGAVAGVQEPEMVHRFLLREGEPEGGPGAKGGK